ncbi:MAG: DUF433 domain-containing protein [Chloroflexota bacterium]
MDAPSISVPIRTDEHRAIRVGGTRVLLDLIVIRYQQGDTPEQIHEGFPTVKLLDIYAVITYYLDNKNEVDEYLRRRDEEAKEIRRKIEAERPDVFAFEAILRERLAKREI